MRKIQVRSAPVANPTKPNLFLLVDAYLNILYITIRYWNRSMFAKGFDWVVISRFGRFCSDHKKQHSRSSKSVLCYPLFHAKTSVILIFKQTNKQKKYHLRRHIATLSQTAYCYRPYWCTNHRRHIIVTMCQQFG